MKLVSRSYGGKVFRPSPIIHQEVDGSLLVVAFPWGDREMAKRSIDDMVGFLNAAISDVEVTTPFEVMTNLTRETNALRTALLFINESVWRSDNKVSYSNGWEVLLLRKTGSQVSWARVGGPSLLVQRKDNSIFPISVGSDLVITQGLGASAPPLPAEILGLERHVNISCGDFLTSEGDQLILFSASVWPGNLMGSPRMNLDSFSHLLTGLCEDSPFWAGIVSY
ncbi:MAG: hypothetical protein N2578_00125 [Bdellovibrionaceae bacterium]|nr:hypothetical protein [Pseudobdellovibrionaceae bacterium]